MNATATKNLMHAANEVLKTQVLAGVVENTRTAKVAAYEIIVEMILELKTATVTQHNAKCACGMNMPLMPGMVATACKPCNVRYDLPELSYGLSVTVAGAPLS